MTNCTFFWENLFDKATLTASSANPNFPVSRIQHRWHVRTWRSADGAAPLSANIVIDLGSAKAIQSLIIKNHNFSSSAVVKIQGNAANDWAAPAVDVTLTIADLITYFWTAEQEYRYWRLLMTDASPVTTYLEIGRLFLGPYFSPSINLSNDYTVRHFDPSGVDFSDGGQITTSQRTRFRVMDMSFLLIPPADLAEFEDIFADRGIGREFFFTRDRDLASTTTIYARMATPLQITHIHRDQLYDVAFSIEELR